jgi:hypothetical protein
VWPWAGSPKEARHEVHVGDVVTTTDTARVGRVVRGPPPPKSFEEVAERLNELRAEVRSEIGALGDGLRKELREALSGAKAESARRDAELGERVEREIQDRLGSRKLEGGVFAGGLAFQFAGAVLLLIC